MQDWQDENISRNLRNLRNTICVELFLCVFSNLSLALSQIVGILVSSIIMVAWVDWVHLLLLNNSSWFGLSWVHDRFMNKAAKKQEASKHMQSYENDLESLQRCINIHTESKYENQNIKQVLLFQQGLFITSYLAQKLFSWRLMLYPWAYYVLIIRNPLILFNLFLFLARRVWYPSQFLCGSGCLGNINIWGKNSILSPPYVIIEAVMFGRSAR